MGTDYGEAIADVLRDVGGNGHRAESVARLTHAFLFNEATKATADAHRRGFPLVLRNDPLRDEDFMLGDLASPRVAFERRGDTLRMIAHNVPSAALGGEPTQHEWTPGATTDEDVRPKAGEWILWAVRVLARVQAVRR